MKTIEAAEVAGLIEEADDDLFDAGRLAGRSAPAARYSASQGAEKYLRALCEAADRPAGVMWDIGKVFETVKDIGELSAVSDQIAVLALFTTPAKAGDGRTSRMTDVMYAAKKVRWAVRKAFNIVEAEPTAPEPGLGEPGCASSEVIDSAIIDNGDDGIPTVLPDDPNLMTQMPSDMTLPFDQTNADRSRSGSRRHDGDSQDVRSGRSTDERGSSFVKVFLMCERCGVRIPRTRQTATGQIPCAMCGRPMKLQK